MIRDNLTHTHMPNSKTGGKGWVGRKNLSGKHYLHFSDEELERVFQLVCLLRGLEDRMSLTFERQRKIYVLF